MERYNIQNIEELKNYRGEERIRVAEDTTSPEVLAYLSSSKVEKVRCAVAGNPNCPIPILETLSQDESSSVRHSVSISMKAPDSILLLLSQDKDWNVRYSVARHPNLSIETMSLLSRDKCDYIVSAIAGREDAPAEILRDIYNRYIVHTVGKSAELIVADRKKLYQYETVLNKLAGNPSCPPDILVNLSNIPLIKSYTVINPNMPKETLLSWTTDPNIFKIDLARNPGLPEEAFEVLSKNTDYKVREGVAENKNCPPHTLEYLSKDQEGSVRCAVAGNKNCPYSVLSDLTKDYDLEISNTAREILEIKNSLSKEHSAKQKNKSKHEIKI